MSIEGKKIMITGGAGFIGSHLSNRLSDKNELVIFDNFSRGIMDENLRDKTNVSFKSGDILVADELKAAMKGCDIVVHLAAVAGIDTVVKKPVRTIEVNFLGSYNVFKNAYDLGIDRVIFASTSEVYGPYTYNAREEDLTTQGPVNEVRWGYAVSKLATDHLAFAFHRQYGLGVTPLRFFNIYGPGQLGEGAIQTFVINATQDQDIVINGDGTQIRAWCYVSDAVDGIVKVMASTKAIGEAFNIGNPRESLSVFELAQNVKRLASSKSNIIFKNVGSYPDVHLRVPNIEKARKILEFEPKVGLEEGIQETINWFRSTW
ncbi:MAG: NAD-dependent epimerase/dehydratase family protein [Thermoplasmata archaeon]|nr:MAG: NAD-dependent epimerase/dehydratase family protein [Thermoplasmata archaeon]